MKIIPRIFQHKEGRLLKGKMLGTHRWVCVLMVAVAVNGDEPTAFGGKVPSHGLCGEHLFLTTEKLTDSTPLTF